MPSTCLAGQAFSTDFLRPWLRTSTSPAEAGQLSLRLHKVGRASRCGLEVWAAMRRRDLVALLTLLAAVSLLWAGVLASRAPQAASSREGSGISLSLPRVPPAMC